MRSTLVVCLLTIAFARCGAQSTTAAPQAPPPARAPADAPASGNGIPEAARVADDLESASQDIKRLQTRLSDWAAVGWYAEENRKLGPPREGQPRVVFLGDSITHNWANTRFSDYFTRAHQGFVPIGRGIGGQTVPQMLVRMRPDVIDLNARVMILWAGTNDLPTFKVPDLLQSIEDNFLSVFDLADAHHIRVVVCSILPVNDMAQPRTATRHPEDIMKLNAWLRQTASERGYQYADFYAVLNDGNDRLKKDLTLDGLHPTAAGYRLIEPIIESSIQKALAD